MWKDEKYLVFPYACLVGGVEKWEGGKLFCLVGGVEKWEGGKLFCLVREKWKDEKCNLYKLIIIPLLHNM